jgi:hypothetical protein
LDPPEEAAARLTVEAARRAEAMGIVTPGTSRVDRAGIKQLVTSVRKAGIAVSAADYLDNVEVPSRADLAGLLRMVIDALRDEARRLRSGATARIVAPSAALKPGKAYGTRVDAGSRPASPRDGRTVVVFGRPEILVGWVAAEAGQPPVELLDCVRHFALGAEG